MMLLVLSKYRLNFSLCYSKLFALVECQTDNPNGFEIQITWSLVERQCWFDAPDVSLACYSYMYYGIENNSLMLSDSKGLY